MLPRKKGKKAVPVRNGHASPAAADPERDVELRCCSKYMLLHEQPRLVAYLLLCCSCASVDAVRARVWDHALPEPLLQHAAAEVDHLFAPGPHAVAQRAKSLWIPLHADGSLPPFALPRVVQRLQRLAASLFDGGGPSIVGAEVWAQHRDGMPLHYDRDEVMFARSGGAEQRHPIASTVTYLRGAGAPTLILNHTPSTQTTSGPAGGTGARTALPSDGWLVWPRVGRHVVFRGDLLHGVVASLAPPHGLPSAATAGSSAGGGGG